MKLLLLILFISVFTSCSEKNKKSRESSVDFCSLIHRNKTIKLSQELTSVKDSMTNKTGVFVLEDGGESLIARAWLSEYAEKTIDIQYFIFSTDNVGLIACDYLVRAADRGVKVRIMVDDIMVEASIEDLLMLDSHENISIKVYNPGVNLGKNVYQKIKKFSTEFRSSNQRMHNKTFTVDGKVCITGGRNIADEYFDYDHEYNFRDRDILLLGKEASTIQNSFNQFWENPLSTSVEEIAEDESKKYKNDDRFNKLHQYACNPENFWPQVRTAIDSFQNTFASLIYSGKIMWLDSVSFVSDEPGKNDGNSGLQGGGNTTSALIDLIQKAKTSIDIQSPYLITTEVGEKIFREAVTRGVKIKILTNSLASTDNLEAFSGYQKCRENLLKSGIRIFEFKPNAQERYTIMTGALQSKIDFKPVFGLHAKSMVIDGKTTVIGTFNLDPRSANLNTECIVIVNSKSISQGVLKGMEIEFQPENSWETTLKFNPDKEAGLKKRLKTFSKKVVPVGIL